VSAFGRGRRLRKLHRRGLRVRRRYHQRRDGESRCSKQHQAKVRHDNFYPNKIFDNKWNACLPRVTGVSINR
jgi:hypothetical protein